MNQSNLINSSIKHKTVQDNIVHGIFLGITIICAAIIIVIVAFILLKGIIPFTKQYLINGEYYRLNFWEFLFGNKWDIAPIHFGVGYIFLNTIYVTLLALVIAIPVSILTSLFIVRIAPKPISLCLKIIIEMLASVPSIIYGLFGQAVLTQAIKNLANVFNVQTFGGQSVLTTALVLGIMIYPTITMVSITSIEAVKKNIINGSLALGASMTQTNFKVVLKSAKNGIFSGVILGVGRALGEATAVSKVCGNAQSGPSFSLFDTTSTLTTTILSNFTEAVGVKYDIKFSVGVVLIIVIIGTNLILNMIKKRVGEISNA